jgi:hypothetical protein
VRKYELYTFGPGGSITNKTAKYRSGMWIASVRALNIRQAYYLLANEIESTGGLGITGINNSLGPSRGWPWKSEKLYPKHWQNKTLAFSLVL